MTDKKLTPDELANAIKDMIAANGDALTGLSFDTVHGTHSYKTISGTRFDGTMFASFRT